MPKVSRNSIAARSLALHKKLRGKIAVVSKQKIRSKQDLSLVYTPGVAAAVRAIAKKKSLARDLTWKGNSVAIVTDGSAILGLGNLGPEAALPVMEGKAALFKELADIDAVPICLATQDTEEIIRTVKALAPGFGGINLEDIAAPRCFEIERRLKAELDIPVMHDDQWGTSVVVLAALINALKIKKLAVGAARIVVNGAGAAGLAITWLLLEYGFRHIVVLDSRGALYTGREHLSPDKEEIAAQTNLACRLDKHAPGCVIGGLQEALSGADVFIGVSQAGALDPSFIGFMNRKPVILALANPDPEILPDAAKQAGAFIVATGRSDFPNQINNSLAFPGIFRGALDGRVKSITFETLCRAAEALARSVRKPRPDALLPAALDKKAVRAVARAIR